MPIHSLFRPVLVALAVACAPGALAACSKPPEVTAESLAAQHPLTEQHEPGAVTMTVAGDGQVSVLVKDRSGKPIEEGVSGTLSVKVPGKDAAPATVELKPAPKSGGVLTAKVPPFEDDLTEVNYEIKVGGDALKGVLHVPHGGTKELDESATANSDPKLEGKKGPNGGTLQRVGDDIVEIVADKSTGELRVYVLDLDLKPVPIGERQIKLAITTTAGSEVVVLAPGAERAYFTGKLTAKVNPVKITVVLTEGDHTDVVLCNYHPGTTIVVGPAAPGIAILVATSWAVVVQQPRVVVDAPVVVVRKGKGKGKFHIKKRGVHIKF
jgi:hypothetical protein